jgi:hypothetical protein
MVTKQVVQAIVMMSLLICSMPALAQYEEEPYIEGYVAVNYTLPMGHLKNDLVPDSLNATGKIGFDIGLGYYVKPKLVVGLYYSNRNMGTEELDLNHRVYEVGSYGKFFFFDLTEASFSPYVRLSAGLNFSKMVTKVEGEIEPLFRELSLSPSLGAGIGLGIHYKTNEFGAFFAEASYNQDFTKSVNGEYRGVDYDWGDDNNYLLIKAGVSFNIGPKE